MEHIAFYLKDIYLHRKSGPLIFKHEGIQKYLFFHDGFLVFAKITHPQELLGEILFKLGKISKATYSKIDQYIDPMHKIGEILIKEGLLSENDLYDGLAFQMREITLNIFPFFDGKFKFQERSKFIEEEFKSKITIPDLIEEGIRRMKNYSQLEKFMENKVPFPKSEDFMHRLTEEERKIFGTIGGSSSAKGILHSRGFKPRLFWKSLYLFYCLNLIDIKDVEKVPEKKLPEEKVPVKKEKAKKVTVNESEKKMAEVVALSERLSTMDYYQILNVSQNDSSYQIKMAYFRLARKYHPDCFDQDLPSDIKAKIEDLFDHITKAYNTLSNERKRQGYDSKSDTSAELGKVELEKKADVKYRQGRTLYNQERYEDALIPLEEAARLSKSKGIYFLLLAMAESKVPPFHRKAEEDFRKAIKLEPLNPECYVGFGIYYKEEGLLVKAKKQFKKALGIDPEHKVALKELGLKEKPEKKKGLTGIFSFEPFRKKKK